MQVRNINTSQSWFEVLQTSEKSQTAVMILASGQASGEEAEAHAHSDQSMLVVTGSIEGKVGDEHLTLSAGDVIIIPAATKHRFWNPGERPATTFNVYSPPEYPADTRE